MFFYFIFTLLSVCILSQLSVLYLQHIYCTSAYYTYQLKFIYKIINVQYQYTDSVLSKMLYKIIAQLVR